MEKGKEKEKGPYSERKRDPVNMKRKQNDDDSTTFQPNKTKGTQVTTIAGTGNRAWSF